MLTDQDFEEQGDAPIAIDEFTRVRLGDEWPPHRASTMWAGPIGAAAPQRGRCLECNEEIRFDDQAIETITFRRMCEDRQTIFSCPRCGCRHVIFAGGEVPVSSTSDCVTVHAPKDGYFLAKASDQKSHPRQTIAG